MLVCELAVVILSWVDVYEGDRVQQALARGYKFTKASFALKSKLTRPGFERSEAGSVLLRLHHINGVKWIIHLALLLNWLGLLCRVVRQILVTALLGILFAYILPRILLLKLHNFADRLRQATKKILWVRCIAVQGGSFGTNALAELFLGGKGCSLHLGKALIADQVEIWKEIFLKRGSLTVLRANWSIKPG